MPIVFYDDKGAPLKGHRKPRRTFRRDPQKHRVYAAERAAFPTPKPGPEGTPAAGPDLPEVADVQRYLDKIQTDRWFRRLYPHMYMPFVAADGRGLHKHGGNAEAVDQRINIRRDHRYRWVVLHEVAHCLTPAGSQVHGPEYVKIYLALVRHFLGRAAWRELHRQCKLHRVKMQVRKRTGRTMSRVMTPAEKAVLLARFARGRAAKARVESAAILVHLLANEEE